MAADLVLRTDKADYASGDTVCGAVYLKITGPTSAYGIRIKFYGYETFMYASKKNASDDDIIHDTKEYVASDLITLYEFEGPIALGQYVFPFQKRLPMELPGSTHLTSAAESNSNWKVEIVYGVEASLLGATGIKSRQNFIVTQPLVEMLSLGRTETDGFVESKSVRLYTWLPFVMVDTNIRVTLDQQQYHTGDNLKMKLDIENSGFIKPKIESILFQLLRDLRMTFRKSSPKDELSRMQPGMSETLGWLLRSRGPARLKEEFIPDQTMSSGYVHPEGNSFVVQSSRLVDIERTNFINGIQEILLPLKDDRGTDVPATTIGNNVWLMYSLKVTLKFERNEPVVLHLPICSVLPRFPEWFGWKPGDWIYECKVMTMEKSPCFVCPEVRESVRFSTLPSFQVV